MWCTPSYGAPVVQALEMQRERASLAGFGVALASYELAVAIVSAAAYAANGLWLLGVTLGAAGPGGIVLQHRKLAQSTVQLHLGKASVQW